MPTDRLSQQIAFILEIDRLKQVNRQTLIADASRRENDAEHSWHLAMMAGLLAEYGPPALDAARVTRMLLVHDVVEIDRKSTRLNSSHTVISYAVFCLEKKKYTYN